MSVLLFFICLMASAIGTIVGAGGGVIIKPVVDAMGLLPVSSVSFLSGCTVLAMSSCSLFRSRHDGIALRYKTTVPLAIGAACGGVIGKLLFEFVRNGYGDERMLGMIQAACLFIFTAFVFVYVLFKNRLPSKQIDSQLLAFVIGILLGCISSFLGIGGGTSNVAVLFFFFSMDAKQAARNSIFIILFSQLASLALAIFTNTVPAFTFLILGAMVLGGILGAVLGNKISSRMNTEKIEFTLKILLLVIIIINLSNFIKFICD